MSSKSLSEQVRAEMQSKYPDLIFADSPIHGTYGLVWLARDSRTDQALAFKTLDFDREDVSLASQDLAYLQREFRKWMKLPPSRNILSALGYDLIYMEVDGAKLSDIPVMRMKGMAGSLESWIGNDAYSYAERLSATLQLFSGLEDLYNAGIEGHGDLKPSNILYTSLSDRYSLPDGLGWPTIQNPWQIVVADFGWADAWVDLGFIKKASRDYMAPERLDGVFVKSKSDIFAAGLIAAALFSGKHPARNYKKAIKSEGNWRRCVINSDWEIEKIEDLELRALIARCIDPEPDKRPSAAEALTTLCEIFDREFKTSVATYLPNWKLVMSDVQLVEQMSDAALRSMDLGKSEREKAASELVAKLNELPQENFDDIEKWSICAAALIQMYEQDDRSVDITVVSITRAEAKHILLNNLDRTTANDIENMRTRVDWPASIHPFERFSTLVEQLAGLVGINFELENSEIGLGLSGKVLLGALAFQSAAKCRYSDLGRCIRILDEAINEYPSQPVFHFFRARWIEEHLLLKPHSSEIKDLDIADHELLTLAESDKKMAFYLDPDWVALQV